MPALILISGLIFMALALDVRLRVVRYLIYSRKINSPVKLAVLSDLHSCYYGKYQKTLLNAVSHIQPDAVLLLGDIIDDILPEKNAWLTVQPLADLYPCFYVTGNHEWRRHDTETLLQRLKYYGVMVLRGERVCFPYRVSASGSVKKNYICICGIDDPDSHNSSKELQALCKTLCPEDFNLLLAHRPERIPQYLTCPFDVILSGHAHGGQWRIPGIINGLFTPHTGLFPRYAGGRYNFPDTVFLVSRGLSRENIPVPRLFNRPEVLSVELLPEK